MKKTYSAKPKDIERKWYLVDAEGQVLGRLASQVASILRGKHKAVFTPHMDTGDFVIVINAEKIAVTGKKETDKKYYRHSGYPGGIKDTTLAELRAKKPEEVIRKAVKGMLPSGSLGRTQLKKLKVVCGPDHRHEAQKPETLDLRYAKTA
jgi:large subunit ribosomal protein L13